MQSLDVHRPGIPDLQFVLLVVALCTSRLSSLNVPESLRDTIFDRCWALVNDGPPPTQAEERVVDLRAWTDVTLEAMVETIRGLLSTAGITTLTWDHPVSESTQTSTPEALPLIERLQTLYPQPPDIPDHSNSA